MNIKNEKWANDHSMLDAKGTAEVDHFYSKAYVRHLLKSSEYLGLTICSIHNLAFYLELARQARIHIVSGDFSAWKDEVIPKLNRRL